MNSNDIVISYIKANPTVSQRSIAKALYADYPEIWSTVDAARSAVKKNKNNVPEYTPEFNTNKFYNPQIIRPAVAVPDKPPANQTGPLSEAEIRQTYDIRVVVQQALSGLKEGEFWPEQDFLRTKGLISKPGYRPILDAAKNYRGKAQGKVFYSHPNSIQKLKNEGVLL